MTNHLITHHLLTDYQLMSLIISCLVYSTEQVLMPLPVWSCFLAKLNPSCTAFFQYPKPNVAREDTLWYKDRPLEARKLSKMMRIISVGAELSQIYMYTNHSVSASAISCLSEANVPDRHIVHFRTQQLAKSHATHYSSRPSVTQLESVSDTILNAVENNQPQSTEISNFTQAPLIQSSNRMSSNVSLSTDTASFLSGFFNVCNIQGIFSSQSHSGNKIWVAISSILYYISKVCHSILLSLRFSIPWQVTLDSSLTVAWFPWTNHNSLPTHSNQWDSFILYR